MKDLKENLNNVRTRVARACEIAARDPSEVAILAVSKRHSVDKIRQLHALGQISFGENYVKEALDKMAELEGSGIEWHFIGPLQSNKTKHVAGNFHWAQSVDRQKILQRLSSQRPETSPPLNVCIQVNIDRERQKAGALPEQATELAHAASQLPGIRLRGLMAIPMIGSENHDPAESYRKMYDLYRKLLDAGLEMDTLSMGMSADLEAAVTHGSTMVRIGTDLFGPRPD